MFDPRALESVYAEPLKSENFYRLVNSTYSSGIDEIGPSMLYGARYNPKGEFGALYLGIRPECVWLEKLKQVGGNSHALPPQTIGGFRVHLKRCLNLTAEAVLKHLGLTVIDLVNPADYNLTQQIGRAARQRGFEGLLVPSAVEPTCKNLAVFKDKFRPPSFCILDDKSVKAYRP